MVPKVFEPLKFDCITSEAIKPVTGILKCAITGNAGISMYIRAGSTRMKNSRFTRIIYKASSRNHGCALNTLYVTPITGIRH